MNIDQVCNREDDINGDLFSDYKGTIIFIISPFGDNIFCYTSNEIKVFSERFASSIIVRNRERNTKVFRIPYLEIWFDTVILEYISFGRNIFYLYESYITDIDRSNNIVIHSVLPISQDFTQQNNLSEIRNILSSVIPSLLSKQEFTMKYLEQSFPDEFKNIIDEIERQEQEEREREERLLREEIERQEQLQIEQRREQERIERLQIERERKERKKLEKQRKEKERYEKERLSKLEKQEKERYEKERREKDKIDSGRERLSEIERRLGYIPERKEVDPLRGQDLDYTNISIDKISKKFLTHKRNDNSPDKLSLYNGETLELIASTDKYSNISAASVYNSIVLVSLIDQDDRAILGIWNYTNDTFRQIPIELPEYDYHIRLKRYIFIHEIKNNRLLVYTLNGTLKYIKENVTMVGTAINCFFDIKNQSVSVYDSNTGAFNQEIRVGNIIEFIYDDKGPVTDVYFLLSSENQQKLIRFNLETYTQTLMINNEKILKETERIVIVDKVICLFTLSNQIIMMSTREDEQFTHKVDLNPEIVLVFFIQLNANRILIDTFRKTKVYQIEHSK